jgi:DNA polymerase-3 subunit epsilon
MSLLAVVDVETTGVNPYRHDRIVEIAIVVVSLEGASVREFVSLVNPERDIGPSSIHGLASKDIIDAPRFADLAGDIVEALRDCVALGGHNVRFDRSFLESEFSRLGLAFPEITTFCSMQLAGGGDLCSCCDCYGVAGPEVSHCALHDARATARLLTLLLRDSDYSPSGLARLPVPNWPVAESRNCRRVTRDESRNSQKGPPRFLQRMLDKLQRDLPTEAEDSAVLAYTALLDRVLEDRHIDATESDSLVEVASKWGLSLAHIRDAHHDYALRLSAAALADGQMSDAERQDLLLVAHLLGIEANSLESTVSEASEKLATLVRSKPSPSHTANDSDLKGKRVCFTGEFQCSIKGEFITRELASEFATKKGLVVADSVTKKLDLLVVADPQTQSGKAKKARQYGIRILHEPVFWKAIGVAVD